MPIDQIDIGESTTLRAVFSNGAGVLADPTNITLTVTRPDGTVFATVLKAAMTTAGTGKWEYDVTPDVAGVWTYNFASSGVVNSDQTEYFLVGASHEGGPCDAWCMPDDIFTVPPLTGVAAAERDYVLAAQAVDAASHVLFRLSGYRYTGICRATVRPCRRSACWGTPYAAPYRWNSSWGDCGCGADDLRSCGCSGLSEVTLVGEHPILGIRQVRVDGVVLAPSTYRVDDGRYLVRLGGEVWPSCQDLSGDPATDPNTWDVDVFFGRAAPADGVLAARLLAAQLYAGQKHMECSLPATIRSRSYQGVEEEIISLSDLEDGKFGIREVDWFLNSEMQAKKRRPTLVASPDFLPATRRTGTA